MGLVRESLYNFHKTGDVKSGLGVGYEAIKNKIRQRIIQEAKKYHWGSKFTEPNFDILKDDLLQKDVLINRSDVLEQIMGEVIKRNDPIELSALREILEAEILIPPKLEIKNYGIIKNLLELGWMKDSYIDSYNFRDVWKLDRERALEFMKGKNPNFYITIGAKFNNRELIKAGIEAGATNTNIFSNLPINLAASRGDTEMVRILLSDPKVDPTENTPDGKRYKTDETNFPIREAAKNGYYEVVELLIKDPRVNPTAKNNFAIKHAFNNGHFDIVELLLKDERVRRDLYLLPKTVLSKISKKFGLQESVDNKKWIEESREEDLEIIKSFDIREELCPDIFEEDSGESIMKEDIRKSLLRISEKFIDYIGIELDVDDICLTGSLANYNWSNFSDVDIHIIVDFSQFDVDPDLIKELFDAKRYSWNLSRNISVKGFEVELYIQDIEETHSSSGIYSIMNGRWIVEPSFENYKIDKDLILSKAENYMDAIDKLVNAEMEGEDVSEEQDSLKRKIKKFRQSGLEDRGEFSYENLVFKLLRRNSYIEKLFDSRQRIEDKKLSVSN